MPNGRKSMSLIQVKHTEQKESIVIHGKERLRIHLRCPRFEGNEAVCQKLNSFYGDTEKEFWDFCKKRYAPALARQEDDRFEARSASMNWYLTFENGKLLSILTDISVFDGTRRHVRRYAHTWDLFDCVPIAARKAFDTGSAAKRRCIHLICEKIRRKEGGLPFDKNAESTAARYFDFDRYYLTPNGVAFYYKNGLLFPSDSRCPAFVIPYEQVEGLRLPIGNEA